MPNQDPKEQIIDYSSIVENANEMIIRFDTDFRHIYCNQAVEKQLGLPKNILLGKSPQEIGGPPDQVKVITQSLQKTLDSQQEQEVEQSYPTPIGVQHFHTRIVPEFNSSGKISSLLAISRDITERKNSESILLKNERRFKNIFSGSPIGIGLYDNKGQLLEVNQSCLEIFGITDPKEIKGFSLFDDPNLLLEQKTALNNGKPARYEVDFDFKKVKEQQLYQTSCSGIKYLDVIITPLKEDNQIINGYLVQIQDITENIRVENRLKESEGKFQMLFNIEPDFLALIDKNTGAMLEVNQAFIKHYGYTKDEVLTMKNTDFSAEPEKTKYASMMQENKIPIRWHKKKDGSIFPTEIVSNNFSYKEKEVHFVAIRDITARVQADKKIKESEERLVLTLKGTQAAMWDWYVDTDKTVFNERWAEMIGYTLEELEPVSVQTWNKFTHPDDLHKSNELLEKYFRGELDYYECEARMKHKNGKWIWVLDRGMISEWDKEGNPVRVTGTHMDITARKQTENQIKASLKEKETLLQEIHHRVKNNMTVISSLLGLQANSTEDERLKDALTVSQNRVQSMSAIHEVLYQSDNLSSIDMNTYLSKLSSAVAQN